MTYQPTNTVAPFVDETVYFPTDYEQFLLKLTDTYRDTATCVNLREIGAYEQQERVTGSTLFNATNIQRVRPVFRKVINFGALPNATSKSVAHGINVTSTFQFLKMYGVGNNPAATGATVYAVSIPNNESKIELTQTNVIVTTTANYSAFTVCAIVLEYVKTL